MYTKTLTREGKPPRIDRHPFNGLFSRTFWVGRHQKVKPFWILMKQKDDRMQMALSRPYANHLHRALERQPCQHRFFTGRMLFLMPNQQCQSTEADKKEIFSRALSYCDFLRYLLSWPRLASSITSITLSVLQTPINRTMNSLLRLAISFASPINSAFNQPSLSHFHDNIQKRPSITTITRWHSAQRIPLPCHTQTGIMSVLGN